MARWAVGLMLLLAQVVALVPAASAQSARPVATWNPARVTGATLAGICPTEQDPESACPVERGLTYTASVTVELDQPAESLLIEVEGGGLDVEALSRTTRADYTRSFPRAGTRETIDLTITIPEADPRRQRDFYIGRVNLLGAERIAGSLLISIVVPRPRIVWGRVMDPATGEKAPIRTIVGSGDLITRQVDVTSSLDLADFQVRSNNDQVAVSGIGGSLRAGVTETATLQFRAPIVNRVTRTTLLLTPSNGLQPLYSSLRINVIVLPAEVRWSPPQVRNTLTVQSQTARTVTVTVTSNYDIPDVQFRTADLGLTPIVAPLGPVNLRAGVPQRVTLRMCPGYAPTTYFLGITAYQGSKPLNRRLPVQMLVEDTGQPVNQPSRDPCAT